MSFSRDFGRGTECGAWLDAPRFAAKPQVQRSVSFAPTARPIKPESPPFQTDPPPNVPRDLAMPPEALGGCRADRSGIDLADPPTKRRPYRIPSHSPPSSSLLVRDVCHGPWRR